MFSAVCAWWHNVYGKAVVVLTMKKLRIKWRGKASSSLIIIILGSPHATIAMQLLFWTQSGQLQGKIYLFDIPSSIFSNNEKRAHDLDLHSLNLKLIF